MEVGTGATFRQVAAFTHTDNVVIVATIISNNSIKAEKFMHLVLISTISPAFPLKMVGKGCFRFYNYT